MLPLQLALQVTIVYMAIAVLVGVAREPSANAVQLVALSAVFAGLMLGTFFVRRLSRGVTRADVRARRHAVAALLIVAAIACVTLAHGAWLGVWGGPARMASVYNHVVQFAGAWSLALAFAIACAICLAIAYHALTHKATSLKAQQ